MGQCVLDTSNIKHINKINTLVVESTDTTVSNTEDDAGERTKSSVTGDGTSVTGIVMLTTSTQSIEDNVNDDDFLNESKLINKHFLIFHYCFLVTEQNGFTVH